MSMGFIVIYIYIYIILSGLLLWVQVLVAFLKEFVLSLVLLLSQLYSFKLYLQLENCQATKVFEIITKLILLKRYAEEEEFRVVLWKRVLVRGERASGGTF
jgi:hypothetical protein